MVKRKRAARAKSARPARKTTGAVLPVYEPEKPITACAPLWARKLNGTIILGSLLFNVAVLVAVSIVTHFATLDFFSVVYNAMLAWAATSTATVAYFIKKGPSFGISEKTLAMVLITMLIFIYYIVWAVISLPVFSS